MTFASAIANELLRVGERLGAGGVVAALVGGFAIVLLGAGCSSDSDPAPSGPTGPGPNTTDPVPDFSLRDVNVNSTRFDEMVSPRDYEGQVSAWYFGHAT